MAKIDLTQLFGGKVVDSVKTERNEVTLFFTDGSTLNFYANGYEGTKLEIKTSSVVTNTFDAE